MQKVRNAWKWRIGPCKFGVRMPVKAVAECGFPECKTEKLLCCQLLKKYISQKRQGGTFHAEKATSRFTAIHLNLLGV
jgi:hypothetical protein